jgi:hypothetical protein
MPYKDPKERKIRQKQRRQRIRKPCPLCDQLMDYRATHCHKCNKGKYNPYWRGGRSFAGNGYILILIPSHPNADKQGRVLEHRLIMENHLGRTLLPPETVHHINGIRNDNRIENLMLFSTKGLHIQHHNAKRKK